MCTRDFSGMDHLGEVAFWGGRGQDVERHVVGPGGAGAQAARLGALQLGVQIQAVWRALTAHEIMGQPPRLQLGLLKVQAPSLLKGRRLRRHF